MKYYFPILTLSISCLSFFSCSSDSWKAAAILQSAEKTVEQSPDRALVILDSIRNPYELNEKHYAEYTLRLVQAKDKAYKDIVSDTLIFKARDYFKKKNDLKNAALSEFYCGRVLQSQGQAENAMKNYLEAKKIAEIIGDRYLCGFAEFFMGGLNYDQLLYDEAIAHYRNATMDWAHCKDIYKKQTAVCEALGNTFLLKDFPDSAFYYYRKGLELAQLNNDSIIQIDIKQNMGVAFLEIGQIDSAKKMTMEALPLSKNKNQQAKLYLNLSKIFYSENKNDSALYYSKLSLELSDDDHFLQASIYLSLSEIEESSRNFQNSLAYHQQYAKHLASILDDNKDVNMLEVQKKYDFELLQNANKELVIDRLWISILFILIIITISLFFLRNHILDREALLAIKQQLYQEKAMIKEKNIKNKSSFDNATDEINMKLRDVLFKQLDILRKISLLENHLKPEEKESGKKILEKVNGILHNSKEKMDWGIFYQIINILYDNFLNRLKALQLSEEELHLCCLLKIGFSSAEIALLTGSTSNIVQKRKSAIRDKLKMKKQESFIKLLDEIVSCQFYH